MTRRNSVDGHSIFTAKLGKNEKKAHLKESRFLLQFVLRFQKVELPLFDGELAANVSQLFAVNCVRAFFVMTNEK